MEIRSITLTELLRKYATLFGAIAIFIIFSIIVDNFFTLTNLLMLLRQMSMLTIISFGFTFVMAAGGFDMSIGNLAGLISVILALMLSNTNNCILAFAVSLGVGLLIGYINGILTAYIGFPDFIATFAVGSVVYGIKMLITKGNPIFLSNPPDLFVFIGQGFIGPIPFPVILMLLFLLISDFILNKTKLGRRVYAIGGNPVASLYAGIKVKKYKLITFLFSGLSVAIASIIMTSRLGSGQPLAGENFLLDVIAVVFLSTTMFGEGEPTAKGAFVGALIISMLNNGLTMLNVQYYFQYITKGLVVIAAIMVSVLLGQKLRIKL